ncbi:Hypothetical predicted protein [Pelobates cultripes]|uniref:Uncharacterized protein n=1 Tax=Pelobates cultripes TaxID=61616 RepID=A0AAD1S6L7_PELCU|nr:Hypothetical predicted protein [Pelobates cultripes]
MEALHSIVPILCPELKWWKLNGADLRKHTRTMGNLNEDGISWKPEVTSHARYIVRDDVTKG